VASGRNAGDAYGWRESRVEDVVAQLTRVYRAYQNHAMDDGASTAAAVHRAFTWEACYKNLTAASDGIEPAV
jgi:hypothetical protein